MRTINRLGLAVAVASAAIAVASPAAAMAEGSTAICRMNEPICPAAKRAAGVHGKAGTVKWKIGMTTVLCLSSLMEASVEGATLANPLHLKTEILTWNNCGTTAAHNNCEVTNEALPLYDVLREAIGLPIEGKATALGWKLKINCSNIFLTCVYGGEIGPFLLEGAGPFLMPKGGYSATELSMPRLSGGLACAAEAEFTAEYEWPEELWTKS